MESTLSIVALIIFIVALVFVFKTINVVPQQNAAQFGFRALASVAVSLLHDRRGASMACVMLAVSTMSLLGQAIYHGRQRQ